MGANGQKTEGLPLGTKLVALIGSVTLVSVLVAVSSFVLYMSGANLDAKRASLGVLVSTLATGAGESAARNDVTSAARIVQSVKDAPSSAASAIYLIDGTRLASWTRGDAHSTPETMQHLVAQNGLVNGVLYVTRDIEVASKTVGHMHAMFTLDDVDSQIRSLLVIGAIVLGVSIIIGLLVAFWAKNFVTRPVDALVKSVTDVRENDDYSVRAPKLSRDELGILADSFNEMLIALERSRNEMVANQRFERDLEIAKHVQTSLVPKAFSVGTLDVAGVMEPAEEVGGDYYDVHAVEDGAWIAVGDVSGHGLNAGLVMLMVHSGVTLLARESPNVSPSHFAAQLNYMVYDNVRQRLGQDEHVTFNVLRYFHNGEIIHAGAHEDILVYRAATQTVESLRTAGVWIGVVPEVEKMLPERRFKLEKDDVALLFTDGVTEGMDENGELFGVDRLEDVLAASGDKDVDEICKDVVRAVRSWMHKQDDDISLLVFRYNAD